LKTEQSDENNLIKIQNKKSNEIFDLEYLPKVEKLTNDITKVIRKANYHKDDEEQISKEADFKDSSKNRVFFDKIQTEFEYPIEETAPQSKKIEVDQIKEEKSNKKNKAKKAKNETSEDDDVDEALLKRLEETRKKREEFDLLEKLRKEEEAEKKRIKQEQLEAEKAKNSKDGKKGGGGKKPIGKKKKK